MDLYTIGFTKKSAEKFFNLLLDNNIERLVDIRVNPQGQLSGFAKQEDLPYLLKELANGCKYIHMPILAPTKELLSDYRSTNNWSQYVLRFEKLMDERNIPLILERDDFEHQRSCLLCSEATPDRCHRRLVAERLANNWQGTRIVHL
jgi:uncharacterized protein (DUF488 family)